MVSLKEIKGRIASVKSTLKITSAMKMVASAHLHKAQGASEALSLYQQRLSSILASVLPHASSQISGGGNDKCAALLAVSSNQSLCGAFNANAIRQARAAIASLKERGFASISIFVSGKKMYDALSSDARRDSALRIEQDWSALSGSPAYDACVALSDILVRGFQEGQWGEVVVIYNHFVSTASQKPLTETYLPFTFDSSLTNNGEQPWCILEPEADKLLSILIPKVLRLRLYSILLDSSVAEHAARTVAMQTATDNGEKILSELTLEYNKGRQQKITSEILDLIGGTLA